MGRPRSANPTLRNKPITVSVTAQDREAIKRRAAAAGLPVSAFLRNAGLGVTIRAAFDQDAILALSQASAEQSRLADVLRGRDEPEAARLLEQIARLQARLAQLAGITD